MARAERPYQASLALVNRSLATPLREALPPLTEEIIAAIRASVPEYAQPLEGSFGRGVRTGVSEALTRFVDMVADPPGPDPTAWERVYFNLGAGEVRAGRTLESLLAAYRVGARVAWRRVAEAAARAGATADELIALAEAIFAYIDEISAISAEGYAAEQASAAGETQRRRERLVRLLIEAGTPPEAIEAAAAQAGWAQPARAAALVVATDEAAPLALRLGGGTIARPLPGGLACAIVPDPDAPGRPRQLASALAETPAAQGPTVPTGELARSYERARLAFDLLRAGVIGGPSPVRAEEHLAALTVHRDPELAGEHAARELAPVEALPERARERMLETLAAWLDHPGRPTEVARAVHVHPQTARYRLAQLRELLGDIDDPERRFALALALRARARFSAAPAR
ncbi:MAG TPA: helix-turn-helix domain-containing protein [Solirubrobacterales bacterium]